MPGGACVRLAVLCVLLAACWTPCAAQPAQTTRHVLILHSYDPVYLWSSELTQGLRSSLQELPIHLSLWTSYLDSRRVPRREAWEWMEKDLALRHQGRRFDVIIACDDPAAEFVLESRLPLLRGVPVVFCGVGSQALIDRLPRDRFTGIREVSAASDFLDAVLKFLPGTQEVVVITDNSPTGFEHRQFYEEIRQGRPHLAFRFLEGSRLSTEEILASLRTLPGDALVVATHFTVDHQGRYVSPRTIMADIARASAAPVVSPHVQLLGQGLLAGNTSAGFLHGEIAGKMAAQVLSGVPPASISIQEHGNIRLVIDDGVAARWGIPRLALPADAELVGRAGGWRALSDADRRLLWAGAALLLLQMITIGVLVFNILRRRRAERELQASRRMLERAQKIARIGLWSRDPETGRLVWSDETARMLGLQPDRVQPSYEQFLSFVHPADRERVDAAVRAADARRQSRVIEYRLQLPGKAERHMRSVGEWTTGPDGRPLVAGMIQDITELKQLEEMVRQMQRMESVGTLAGGVAHDFNNLLTVINGYSQLLSNAMPPDDSRAAYVREIQRAGERAAVLTRQLLAFSRKQILSPRLLDLNKLIRDSEGLLTAVLGDRVRLRFDLADAPCLVHADPVQMEQVLINLAANSRDAMPEGGEFRISTASLVLREYSGPGQDWITPGRYVEVRIADTGCGMDEATRQRVFEPFFTTKPVGKGTGLGLASVYGIVRQSGGHITVESEVDAGTTFRILLPASEGAIPPRRDDGEWQAGQGAGRVLVHESDPDLGDLIGHTLRAAGYEVEFSSDPRRIQRMTEAAELLPGQPDVLLTELRSLQHLDAVRRLRLRFPSLRVLFFTSGLEAEPVIQCRQGEALLEKPFTPAALASAIRSLMAQPAG